MTASSDSNRGFALVAALLMLLMLSAFSVAIVFMANSETQTHTTDLQNTQAYYVAEAGMEKMMVDLSNLYLSRQTPTLSEIQALGSSPPSLPGYTFPAYQFIVPNTAGTPDYTTRTISSGANQGLIAQILPITLATTARTNGGAEVRMNRNIEVALIPVFQFGMFSETDLSFCPGPSFDFAGRVHTNGNLFLATEATTPPGLVFHSKITAAGEIIRAQLSNGETTSSGTLNGPIMVPKAALGCDGAMPNCRDLQENEGSKVGGPTSATNTNWNNLSTNTYNSLIVNGATGARALTLPFVTSTIRPIQIIKRPPAGESPSSAVGQARLYNDAQVRVLLSDDPAELPGGAGDSQNIRLANVGTYATGVPVPGASNTYFAEGKYYATNAGGCVKVDTDWLSPVTPAATGCTSWPLIDGYLRVEARQSNGSYTAVTQEWLQLGFARGVDVPNSETGTTNTVHPNAILILQQLADRNGDGDLTDAAYTSGGTYYASETTTITGTGPVNNWFPINLYSAQEGEVRQVQNNSDVAIGGIMNVVELDVKNLKMWLGGTIGTTGGAAESSSQNGYILYFSDRRGMLPNPSGQKVGEYGFEDVINPSSTSGAPDGALDPSEDVNQNGTLEVYGKANLGDGFIAAAQGSNNANDNPTTRVSKNVGRKNRVSGARHILKLVNGSLGNLPTKPSGTGGFTVASENPVHVQGNYNANSAGFGDPHAAAAIIADSVTLLSNNWKDRWSFQDPTEPQGRFATDTWYRMAVAAGKNIAFTKPAWGPAYDFGTDGGTHNFLRMLEDWKYNAPRRNLYYKGSLASLFFCEYGVGIYKSFNYPVYASPNRIYSFDTEFLDPNKIPPGTPRFQDFVNLGYSQVFTP